MYTLVERWKGPSDNMQETSRRAQTEFFPKLQAAPGFVSFYLVADEANAVNTAIIVWENKAQAEAFTPVAEGWQQVLKQLGHTLQSDNRGETVIELQPKK